MVELGSIGVMGASVGLGVGGISGVFMVGNLVGLRVVGCFDGDSEAIFV